MLYMLSELWRIMQRAASVLDLWKWSTFVTKLTAELEIWCSQPSQIYMDDMNARNRHWALKPCSLYIWTSFFSDVCKIIGQIYKEFYVVKSKIYWQAFWGVLIRMQQRFNVWYMSVQFMLGYILTDIQYIEAGGLVCVLLAKKNISGQTDCCSL